MFVNFKRFFLCHFIFLIIHGYFHKYVFLCFIDAKFVLRYTPKGTNELNQTVDVSLVRAAVRLHGVAAV